MSLQRHEHWATRSLTPFLLERRNSPFAWGTNDCCLFPADAIEAMTGVDIASDFRGKYATEAQAWALVHTVTGGSTVADAAAWCARAYGLTEWTYPLCAQRGDLVVFANEGRLLAGIVHLSGRHVLSVAADGLVKFPITRPMLQRAWKV